MKATDGVGGRCTPTEAASDMAKRKTGIKQPSIIAIDFALVQACAAMLTRHTIGFPGRRQQESA
jgi:hypothetical protein